MDTREKIISESKVVAVVGLSDKPGRPSYGVAEYLKDNGFTIIPVNPNIEEVFGLKSYPSLLDIPKDIHIDVVDIFRRPKYVPDIVDEAIKIGAKAIWMQEGVSHPDAAEKAREHGLDVVQDVCMMKTHRNFL